MKHLTRALLRKTPLSVAVVSLLSVAVFAIVVPPLMSGATTNPSTSPLNECPSQVGIDLSTGTNGFTSPNGALAVGKVDTSWTLTSAPPGVPTGAGSAYSVEPYGSYAKSPYVASPSGGSAGRLNWISYGPSLTISSGQNQGTYSNEPILTDNSPAGYYVYTTSFTAPSPPGELPGTFKLLNFSADNNVTVTLGGPQSGGPWSWSNSSGWGSGGSTSVTTAGTYTLTAKVYNRPSSFSSMNYGSWTAVAVYAVFCQPNSPTIKTTLHPASPVFTGTVVTDSVVLSGASANAGGSVTYEYFSAPGGATSGPGTGSRSCNGFHTNSVVTVHNGVAPDSPSVAFSIAGAFSWNAIYSGDANNSAATSPCEILNVVPITTPPCTGTVTTATTCHSVFQVKFVCNNGNSSAAASSIGLESGFYDTLINIHNPSYLTTTVILVEKFVLSTPQSADLGPPVASQSVPANPKPYVLRLVSLGPDAVVQISCTQILSYLGVESPADGFVLIYTKYTPTATNNVDVWVGYSAANSSGYGVTSFQMVQVQPTKYIAEHPQ